VIVQIAVLPIPLSDKEKGVGIWEFTEERTKKGSIRTMIMQYPCGVDPDG